MKALGGGGGSFSKTTLKAAPKAPVKPKGKPKKMSHSQLAALWQEQGGKFSVEQKKEWSKAEIDRARAAKERAEEAAAEAARHPNRNGQEEEPQEEALPHGQRASELARGRMAELAREMQGLSTDAPASDGDADDELVEAGVDELRAVVACRRSQLEELEMLQAMFVDEFLWAGEAGAEAEAMGAALETLEEGGSDDVEALRSVATAARLEFLLQMTVQDGREGGGSEGGAAGSDAVGEGEEAARVERELVASILLRVRFPRRYPTAGHPPSLLVEDVMISDAAETLGADKVLATLAVLDEPAMVAAMRRRAEEVQPDPCVYEVATWVAENAFDFMRHSWL